MSKQGALTVILTGVGSGGGEHVAKAYAELGANVVISARSIDRLVRDKYKRRGGELSLLRSTWVKNKIYKN